MPFLQHRGRGIVPCDELAMSDLPGSQIDELGGVTQLQACNVCRRPFGATSIVSMSARIR